MFLLFALQDLPHMIILSDFSSSGAEPVHLYQAFPHFRISCCLILQAPAQRGQQVLEVVLSDRSLPNL